MPATRDKSRLRKMPNARAGVQYAAGPMRLGTRGVVGCAAAVIAGAAALYIGAMHVCGDEWLETRRGRVAYYMCLSSVIRNTPLLADVDEPKFFSTVGDGTKLPRDEIVYHSAAPASAIALRIERYLGAHGFARDSSDANVFRGAESVVKIDIRRAAEGDHEVHVAQIF
jgi:hypothetical protein